MNDPLPFFVLDARNLPAPEPFVQTLELLEQLPAGAFLRLVLPREPFPLYAYLNERDIAFRQELAQSGCFQGAWLIDIFQPCS